MARASASKAGGDFRGRSAAEPGGSRLHPLQGPEKVDGRGPAGGQVGGYFVQPAEEGRLIAGGRRLQAHANAVGRGDADGRGPADAQRLMASHTASTLRHSISTNSARQQRLVDQPQAAVEAADPAERFEVLHDASLRERVGWHERREVPPAVLSRITVIFAALHPVPCVTLFRAESGLQRGVLGATSRPAGLKATSFSCKAGSARARISTASRPAFRGPAAADATVATGTSPGICTVESSESSPPAARWAPGCRSPAAWCARRRRRPGGRPRRPPR